MSKKRWVIEQTLGGLARWFNGQETKFKKLEKVHNQHIMESIVYRLKRAPGMVAFMPSLKRNIKGKSASKSHYQLKNDKI
ncbi:MAG: transposase [Flavobacteriaceae bacterium]|nr:transposase [Flavobacteriaceae bacterium]